MDGYDEWSDFEADRDEEDEPMDECGYIPSEGICTLAGAEHCDWDCTFNPADPIG